MPMKTKPKATDSKPAETPAAPGVDASHAPTAAAAGDHPDAPPAEGGMPVVSGFLAQCEEEKCDEASYPFINVGSEPLVKGRCPAHGPTKTVEEWARDKKLVPQPFGQARMLKGWITGTEIKEREFDTAIADVDNVRHG
jgi:hypothetical protein